MGRSKALEIIDRESLIQQVVHRLSLITNEIIVATAAEQSIISLRNQPEVRIVNDLYPDKGPLGGIYTGLSTANTPHCIIVACDMPFLNQALLRYLVELSPDFDVVVPRIGEEAEPLHAVYSRGCLVPIEYMIQRNELKVGALFPLVRVRYVNEREIDRFDPKHLAFFNINTGADLERAKDLTRIDQLSDWSIDD